MTLYPPGIAFKRRELPFKERELCFRRREWLRNGRLICFLTLISKRKCRFEFRKCCRSFAVKKTYLIFLFIRENVKHYELNSNISQHLLLGTTIYIFIILSGAAVSRYQRILQTRINFNIFFRKMQRICKILHRKFIPHSCQSLLRQKFHNLRLAVEGLI